MSLNLPRRAKYLVVLRVVCLYIGSSDEPTFGFTLSSLWSIRREVPSGIDANLGNNNEWLRSVSPG